MDNPRARLRTAGLLTLAGLPSYVLCTAEHLCMAGHMQHGPYLLGDMVNDVWWVACLAAGAIVVLGTKVKRRLWIALGSFLVILSRIVLGALSEPPMVELVLMMLVAIQAIAFIVAPSWHLQKDSQ